MHPDDYQVQPKCLCGTRDWRKDEYRHRVEKVQMRNKQGRYALCHSCFHYPHRIGSVGCIFESNGSYRNPSKIYESNLEIESTGATQ